MELYKRIMLILMTGIMAIGLICFKVEADKNKSGADSTVSDSVEKLAESTTPSPTEAAGVTPTEAVTEVTQAPSPTPVPEGPTPTPEPNPLRCEIYPQIHTLIENYFNAKLSCDLEDFRKVVTDVSYINIDAIARSTESVRAYSDITVYTKRGYGNIDLVVYCTYNMIVPNVDSPVASIDSFYIVYDTEGNPRIFSGILEDAVIAKLLEMDNDDEVLALKTYVATEIAHSLEKDSTLVDFWENMLSGIPKEILPEDNVTSSEN